MSAESSDLEIWSGFVADWNSHSPARLARWSPKGGVLLLDNPGAFARVKLLSSAPALLQQEGAYDGARIQTLEMRDGFDAGPPPKTSCEGDTETPAGIFSEETDGARLVAMIEAMQKYELAPKEDVDRFRQAYAETATARRMVVVDTKNHVAFYFARNADRVVLFAVDAIVPCSA